MKRYLTVRVALFALMGMVAGCVFWSMDTYAYWTDETDSKGVRTQCFSIQYELQAEHSNQALNEYEQKAVFSTDRLCAVVDKDTEAIKGDLIPMSRPEGTREINNQLSLDIYRGSDNRGDPNSSVGNLRFCTDYKYLTVSCANASWTNISYPVVGYSTFRKIAEKATSDANGQISTNVFGLNEMANKMGLDDNRNNDDVGKEAVKDNSEEAKKEVQEMKENSICYEASGHLGWIFCPLIEGISKAMDTLYNDIVEPFLVIEPTLLSGDGTYEAWSIFRDFANIAFIILFLVVIFSQLTGYGIDNYGIKRMLPKLIAAAVLINLSYVICQIAVDVSNILGNSLELLFNNIAKTVNSYATSPTEYFSGLLKLVMGCLSLAGGGAALGLAVAPLEATMGFAAIVPMLLGMLSAIISVLFMFVILFVRKAIVILLVVVAPIAFIAYIMPNTKRAVFDKWLNLFKGVLLVYPLAGALVGGGTLASAIIVAAAGSQAASGDADMGTFLLYLGALLLQVVPFFFLPTLFRRSLSAAGNIGERIATRGRQAGQRTRGAIEGSNRYKEWQRNQQEATANARAIRVRDRLRRRVDAGGNLSERDQRRLRVAEDTMLAYEEGRLADRASLDENRYASRQAAQEAKAHDDLVNQRLSLMQRNGVDGVNGHAYSLDNVMDRMTALRDSAANRELNPDEQLELEALARGAASMKGGGGRLGTLVRGTDDGHGSVNHNFMRAMGNIYSHDAAVRSKMDEKDAGAATYTEQFMPGNNGAQSFSNFQGTAGYRTGVNQRVRSYDVGLNQSGVALDEYLRTLGEDDCQRIMNDDKLLNSLATDDRNRFLDYAAGRQSSQVGANGQALWDYSNMPNRNWSVTGKSAQRVVVDNNQNGTP